MLLFQLAVGPGEYGVETSSADLDESRLMRKDRFYRALYSKLGDGEMFAGRQINVEIETEAELTLGMTVADWWRVTDRPANALFIKDIDAGGFYDLLADRLARL